MIISCLLLTGAVAPAYGANSALSLDGIDDEVDIGDPVALQITGALAVEVWFRTTASVGDYNTLLSKWWSGGSEGTFSLYWTSASGLVFALHNQTLVEMYVASGQFLNDGLWHHAAGTWDGATARIYIDGAEADSSTDAAFGSLRTSAASVKIGNDGRYDPGTGDRYFGGQVDEVRIWDVARTQEEILAGMNSGLTGSEPGLVGYWNFDAGAAADLTPNGNDGSMLYGAGTTPIAVADFSLIDLDFGVVGKDGPGSAIAFTIHNSGDEALTVTSMDSTDASQFIASGPVVPFELLPGDTSGGISVTLAPTRVGHVAANILIDHNARGMRSVPSHGIGSMTPPEGDFATTMIAFSSFRDGNNEIYVTDVGGVYQRNITNHAAQDEDPTWSPDGRKIAFFSYRDGNRDIYTIDVLTSALTRLTDDPAIDQYPTWSPDGAKIAFTSERDGNREIYVMDADGANEVPLTNNVANDSMAAWSPDGAKIVFHSNRDGGSDDIYAMNADGSSQIALANRPGTDLAPAWSPDGTRIAYFANPEGNFDIFVMDAGGRNPENLTNSPTDERYPKWSPDGTHIVFTVESGGISDIYVMGVDGSNPTNMTNHSAWDYEATWSPFYASYGVPLVAGWSLTSVPGPSLDFAPDALMGMWGVDTIYAYDASQQTWTEPITGADCLPHVEKGYFLHRDPVLGEASLRCIADVDDPTARTVNVSLELGWNLVGVVDGGVPSWVFGTGPNTVFAWDGAQYHIAESLLRPMHGYWVFDGDTTRTRPYIVPLVQMRDRGSGAPSPPTPLPTPDWVVSFTLASPGGSTRTVELGASPEARVGYDALDIGLPPLPSTQNAGEFYARAEGIARRLTRSVQPVERTGTEWTLAASVAGGGTLSWVPSRLPSGYRAVLGVDGEPHDLSDGRSLGVDPGRYRWPVRVSWSPPSASRLLANYPNPFNPETWIPFELKEGSEVEVRIYAIGGRVIRHLDLGYREPGYYTDRAEAIYWDGRNETGERVASGVYFYELSAGEFRDVRRMAIMK